MFRFANLPPNFNLTQFEIDIPVPNNDYFKLFKNVAVTSNNNF